MGLIIVSILISVGASSVGIASHAETINTMLAIANAAPSFVSVRTSADSFGSEDYADGKIDTLIPSGAMMLYLTGVIEDTNNRAEIDLVSAVFYRSETDGGADCVANGANDCYVVADCDLDSIVGMSDTQLRYSCPIGIQYYADATEAGGEFADEHWIVAMTASDVHGAIGTDQSQTREIQTLLALDFDRVIDYGTVSLGMETDESTAATQGFAQAGNDRADVELSYSTVAGSPSYGGFMDCVHNGGTGAIPSGRQQWSVVSNYYGGVGSYALTDAQAIAPLDIAYRHGSNPTGTLFWNVSIPESGVSGTCSGSIIVSAVSH